MKPVVSRVIFNELPTFKRKKVCAYARVSMMDDYMMHSLSAQVGYYVDLINSHLDWDFVKVYHDKPMTGTKEERPQFLEMLNECRKGNIDMIITKSISRFARNTITTLNYTRELKRLGVDVYFEEENIHTLTQEGELFLTLYASYAQAESLSVSENCKWRIKKKFENGEPANFRFMYGYNIVKGVISINEEQAEIVRFIFNAYDQDWQTRQIVRTLRERNVPTLFGGEWNEHKLLLMLQNEKYKGDCLLQKRYVPDHLTKKQVVNHGELPKYYAQGTHDAIIDAELFDRVQQKIASHRRKTNNPCSKSPSYPFTGMVVCGNCGKSYRRRVNPYGIKWMCGTYITEGKSACPSKQIPDDTLREMVVQVLNLTEFDEVVLKERVEKITALNGNRLIFTFKDGTTNEVVWKDRSRAESWTPEMKEAQRQRTIVENQRRKANG